MAPKYVGHISCKQKERLIELIGEDDELRKAKFSNRFTKNDMHFRWESIANQLNCIPGAKKTGEQWKRTWKDLKICAKKKNTQTKTYRMGTGGGPPPENPFNSIDEAILKILEPTLLEGDQNVAESSCLVNFSSPILKTESQPININTQNHDYIINDDQENIENIYPTEAVTPVLPVVNPSTPKNDNPEDHLKGNKAKRTVVSRKKQIENHHKNTEKLTYLSERKIEIKKAYYDKKIEILKEHNLQLSRIADSLVELNGIISELI